MSTSKKITLKSSDEETFKVDESVAFQSKTIKRMIEDDCVKVGIIPLPNVTGKILGKVIEYCKKHVEVDANNEELKLWDADFTKVDQTILFDIIIAANHLNIKSLLDLTCKTVADMISGKTPDELRKIFNINDGPTPEEQEEIRREHPWAFE